MFPVVLELEDNSLKRKGTRNKERKEEDQLQTNEQCAVSCCFVSSSCSENLNLALTAGAFFQFRPFSVTHIIQVRMKQKFIQIENKTSKEHTQNYMIVSLLLSEFERI